MDLSYFIVRILQKYSSKEKTTQTKPLSREEIVKRLQTEYPDDCITYKKVRKSLDQLISMESCLPDAQKTICYKTYTVAGQERHSNYYYNNAITDVELKFLVDSTLYSKIFKSSSAQNLAKRIQGLSGKNLRDITSYANDGFGKQRYSLNINVMENVEIIMKAKKINAFIAFDWNLYDVAHGQIVLKNVGRRKVKPGKLILSNGRYFLLLRHWSSDKVYTYAVDLMSNIEKCTEKEDGLSELKLQKDFVRAEYALQHPFMMGGEVRQYKLRVKREYFSRLVDDFAYEIKIIKGSETEETVDVRISAASKGMAYWLLQHYDVAELICNNDEDLSNELSQAVEILYKKYHT